ncbi:hypothetical protein BD310DRAFT_964258 [Dichomitus squalens]|uniref:Uncharacterized protein n=1 Tax=Dichomitus squalens TaxID=114155 RepID=A0A4Q9QB54_9APHY|nr:hypothetical protein BD310DRAFT_964258 [Dichomitus squalens]
MVAGLSLSADPIVLRCWCVNQSNLVTCRHHVMVIEGIIQSAAVYSAASIVLVITAFESPNVGYVACLNIFPALIGLLSSSIVIRLGLQARQESYLPVFQSVPLQIPVASPSAAHHDSCATPLSP